MQEAWASVDYINLKYMYVCMYVCMYVSLYVTGFMKTVPNRTFHISRNYLKYSRHCSSLCLIVAMLELHQKYVD